MKKFKILVFILCFLLLGVSSAYATDEFSPAHDVTYEVQETGQTVVTQNIHLTNLTTNYYASQYSLTFGTEKIENISARDSQGPLKVDIKKGTDLTQIQVTFNEKVVGQGKTLNWTLRFESSEIAKKLGRILEINIPRVSQEEKATAYDVTLIVPSRFGQPAYIWPRPKRLYFWTMEEGSREGINLAFGDWQGFSFNLNYHLNNPYLIPGETFIALPPDTPYQKIILDKIIPLPSDIIVDEDGNWLGKYLLLPKQKLDVEVRGFGQIFLTPQGFYPKEDQKAIYQKYLKSQKFWETADPKIQELAKKLNTPKAIYDYVITTLSYDYQRATQESSRLGAKQVLETPEKAICMEFTDLFIALCRAAGIPAREVDGFAYTSNSRLKPLSLVTDVLHSWPEYWDEKSQVWLQVDPTWGKSSLTDYFSRFDFNHFAFVKRGIDSTSPYPAGSYKGTKTGKDVLVDFSSISTADFTTPINPPKVQILFPKWIIAGIPHTGEVKIKNENSTALYGFKMNLTSSLGTAIKDKEISLAVLPPKTSKTILVKLEDLNPFLYGENVLTLTFGDQKITTNYQIIPLPLVVSVIVLGFFIFILLFRLLIKKLWEKFKFDIK